MYCLEKVFFTYCTAFAPKTETLISESKKRFQIGFIKPGLAWLLLLPITSSVNLTELQFPQPPSQYKMLTIKPACVRLASRGSNEKRCVWNCSRKKHEAPKLPWKNSAVWDVDYRILQGYSWYCQMERKETKTILPSNEDHSLILFYFHTFNNFLRRRQIQQ